MDGLTVVDSSILIAHLEGRGVYAASASKVLAQAEMLAASTLTLAEVLAAPAFAGRLEDALAALNQLAITEVPLELGSAGALARLRAETGLTMPDCCVLYAAASTGARAIATRDGRLARVASARGLATF